MEATINPDHPGLDAGQYSLDEGRARFRINSSSVQRPRLSRQPVRHLVEGISQISDLVSHLRPQQPHRKVAIAHGSRRSRQCANGHGDPRCRRHAQPRRPQQHKRGRLDIAQHKHRAQRLTARLRLLERFQRRIRLLEALAQVWWDRARDVNEHVVEVRHLEESTYRAGRIFPYVDLACPRRRPVAFGRCRRHRRFVRVGHLKQERA